MSSIVVVVVKYKTLKKSRRMIMRVGIWILDRQTYNFDQYRSWIVKAVNNLSQRKRSTKLFIV